MPPNTDASVLWICRAAIAFVWIYHGIFPKLLGPATDELAMSMALGVSRDMAVMLSYAAGVVEILIGCAVLVFRRQRWPFVLTCVSMVLLLAYAAFAVPHALLAAFNPVSLNVAVFALAWIALKLRSAGTDGSNTK